MRKIISPSNSCLSRLNADFSRFLTLRYHVNCIGLHCVARNEELQFLFGLVCNGHEVHNDFEAMSRFAVRVRTSEQHNWRSNWQNSEYKMRKETTQKAKPLAKNRIYCLWSNFVVRFHLHLLRAVFFPTRCQHMACMFMTSQLTILDFYCDFFYFSPPFAIEQWALTFFAININEPYCLVRRVRMHSFCTFQWPEISISVESHNWLMETFNMLTYGPILIQCKANVRNQIRHPFHGWCAWRKLNHT